MKLRNKITNEICDAEMREDGIYIKANWSDEEKWFCYDLETLARGWEYYVEPKEPLIKDEKIRKAVRAWAEANDVLEVFIDRIGDGTYIELYDEDDGRRRISALRPAGLKTGEAYTIAELCGEGEE